MCLIDGEKAERDAPEPVQSIFPREALRGHIEQLVLAAARGLHDAPLFRGRDAAVEAGGRNARFLQLRDLILHEGEQRGNHQRGLAQRRGIP